MPLNMCTFVPSRPHHKQYYTISKVFVLNKGQYLQRVQDSARYETYPLPACLACPIPSNALENLQESQEMAFYTMSFHHVPTPFFRKTVTC